MYGLKPLDLPTLARDYEWTTLDPDVGGAAMERASGRQVSILPTWDRHFLMPFQRAALARRLAEIHDPRLLPVLSTDPWIVVRGRETTLPLEQCFDAALEMLDAVQRIEARGVHVARMSAERVEASFRVWLEPASFAGGPFSDAPLRVGAWLDEALRRHVGTKSLRRKLERACRGTVEQVVAAWATHASPAARERAASIHVVPPAGEPLPDLIAAESVGEARLAASPDDIDVAAALGAIHHHFGCVAMAAGDFDEAERRLDRAVALFPSPRNLTSRALLARRRGDEVLEAALLDRQPVYSMAAWGDDGGRHACARASSLARRGRVEEALRVLDEQVLPSEPEWFAWAERFRARHA